MVCGFMLSMSASSICFARWRWNRAKSLKVAFNCPSVAMAARDSNSAALLKHSRTVVMEHWPRISCKPFYAYRQAIARHQKGGADQCRSARRTGAQRAGCPRLKGAATVQYEI